MKKKRGSLQTCKHSSKQTCSIHFHRSKNWFSSSENRFVRKSPIVLSIVGGAFSTCMNEVHVPSRYILKRGLRVYCIPYLTYPINGILPYSVTQARVLDAEGKVWERQQQIEARTTITQHGECKRREGVLASRSEPSIHKKSQCIAKSVPSTSRRRNVAGR